MLHSLNNVDLDYHLAATAHATDHAFLAWHSNSHIYDYLS